MDNEKTPKDNDSEKQNDTKEEDTVETSEVQTIPPSETNKQAEEYYDQLLRTQAEFENYKKRTEKEIEGFKAFANAQLIKDLLVVMDALQNALASPGDGNDEQFKKGIEMIYRNLYDVLEKEGLCEIIPKDECFDPWKHEAVEMIPTDEVPEHTVIGVIQRGYKFKDKVLRTAKVRVAVEPKVVGEDEEPTDDAEEEESEDSE